MLHVCSNVVNRIEIWRIGRVLMTSHSKHLSDRNTNLLMNRSIVFHDDWLLHLPKRLFPKVFERSNQNLISINSRIYLLSIFKIKKHTWPHLSPPKCPPEHHSGPSLTLFVINTIRVKLFINLAPYPILSAAFHPNFDTHLISPNKCFPILNCQMCIAFCKLKTTFAIEFL